MRRHSLPYLDMDYCVQLAFDNVNAPEEIGPAFEAAKKLAVEYRVPVVVEVIMERVTNISMGTELDNVTEFEDLAARREDAPTAVVSMLD